MNIPMADCASLERRYGLSGAGNVELARACLRLIRDIAEMGANSWDPDHVGYALLELSQVLLERARTEDQTFTTCSASRLTGLKTLFEELAFVASRCDVRAISDRN